MCKLIIVVPILWFALIGVTVVFTEDNNSLGSRQIFSNVGKGRDSNIERRIDDNNNNIDKNHNNDDIKNPNQIVIERPASGRLKGDAGEESDSNKKPVLVVPIKEREDMAGSTTTIDPNAPGQSLVCLFYTIYAQRTMNDFCRNWGENQFACAVCRYSLCALTTDR